MLSPQAFATHLARAVDLFRDPSAKEAQKSALRALMALVQMADVLVETRNGGLFINGSAVAGEAYKPLVERLELHGVRHIEIPTAAPAADLFNLLKSLADQQLFASSIRADVEFGPRALGLPRAECVRRAAAALSAL
ncbi:MAG TPA: hypothetical protein VF923_00810, partial [Gemmatimonadales bacterium]